MARAKLTALGNYPDMPLAQARIEAHQARGLKHPAVPRRYLDKYLLPKLGRFAAGDITPADIARMLDEIKGRAPLRRMICCGSRAGSSRSVSAVASYRAILPPIFRPDWMPAASNGRAAVR
jgi:hypothetical protein